MNRDGDHQAEEVEVWDMEVGFGAAAVIYI